MQSVSSSLTYNLRVAAPAPFREEGLQSVFPTISDRKIRGSLRSAPHRPGTCRGIILLAALFLTALAVSPAARAGGITPEQIYQHAIDWNALMGTWEVLPEGNPLEEEPKGSLPASERTLMTLRVDGTCRVFDRDHPSGSDGLWTFDQHEMYITFKNAPGIELYIYGVKSGFMVTRTPIKNGKDQLWSRIK